MNNDESIKNNPSNLENDKQIQDVKVVHKIVSSLEKIGIKNEQISRAFEQIPHLVEQYESWANLPDKFNTVFGPLGWVSYESMHFDTAKAALDLAEQGNLVEAENVLANYYDATTIQQKLLYTRSIREFQIRQELLLKAKDDYLAERYYASIPIILAMIDGIVSDVNQIGFFAERTDLIVNDSIVGHKSGLQELAKLFSKSRNKTTNEIITIPYRNGILHGRDLGYANKIVAAKTWATLFAIYDLIKAKRNPKKPKEKLGLRDSIKKFSENLEYKKRLEEWKPRRIEMGIDIPRFGAIEEYEENTPERTLVIFLHHWQKHKYGLMAQTLSRDPKVSINGLAGKLRTDYSGKNLTSFSIEEVIDKAAAASEIKIFIEGIKQQNQFSEQVVVQLIYQDEKHSPYVRGDPRGQWYILQAPIRY